MLSSILQCMIFRILLEKGDTIGNDYTEEIFQGKLLRKDSLTEIF